MEIGGVLVGQGRARRTKPKKGTVIGEVSKKGSRVPAGFGMPASTPEKATEATVLLPAAAPKPKRRSESAPSNGTPRTPPLAPGLPPHRRRGSHVCPA